MRKLLYNQKTVLSTRTRSLWAVWSEFLILLNAQDIPEMHIKLIKAIEHRKKQNNACTQIRF